MPRNSFDTILLNLFAVCGKTERYTVLPCLTSSFVSKSKLKEPRSISFEVATVIQS